MVAGNSLAPHIPLQTDPRRARIFGRDDKDLRPVIRTAMCAPEATVTTLHLKDIGGIGLQPIDSISMTLKVINLCIRLPFSRPTDQVDAIVVDRSPLHRKTTGSRGITSHINWTAKTRRRQRRRGYHNAGTGWRCSIVGTNFIGIRRLRLRRLIRKTGGEARRKDL